MRGFIAATMSSCAVLLGCGQDGAFTAQEFVAEANRHGAGLILEGELDSTREDTELHSVELEDPEPGTGARGLEELGHAGGTLTITENEEAGAAEYERCEAAASLLCYRAGNAVLFFEDALQPDELARIASAFRALASEGSPPLTGKPLS